MNLVYQFQSNTNLPRILELCKYSKDLYNQANFAIRQKFIETSKLKQESKLDHAEYLNYYDLDKLMKVTKNLENQINYRKLKSHTSQQILKKLDKNWISFFKSIKDYMKHPSKYSGKPSLPGYKQQYNNLYYTKQTCQIKGNHLYLEKDWFIEIPEYDKFKAKNLCQVEIIPKSNYYIVNINYKVNRKLAKVSKKKYAAIDLGIDNLVTLITSTNSKPIIYDGKQLKSINQYYNKEKAKHQQINDLQKNKYSTKLRKLDKTRNNKVNDYIHKVSRDIIDYCINQGIGKIFIGKNDNWKTNINLGNKNNQNIVSIPHSKLINMIIYKAKYVGIDVKVLNESYTSKCDSLSLEKIEKHEEYKGKRIHRGLFQSNTNQLLNADINGALNILRRGISKCKSNSLLKEIAARGLLFNPVRLKYLDNFKYSSNKCFCINNVQVL